MNTFRISGRQSGKTTRQMLGSPRGAIFLWPVSASLNYARDLARNLGRTDLKLMAATDDPIRLSGLKGDVVIDHACYGYSHLTRQQHEAWNDFFRRSYSLRVYDTDNPPAQPPHDGA